MKNSGKNQKADGDYNWNFTLYRKITTPKGEQCKHHIYIAIDAGASETIYVKNTQDI